MDNYFIRPATLKDIDFIVRAIIESEKSGTDKFGLATLFNLSEENTRDYLHRILEEEIDGCEFSIGSFLVAEFNGKCVAAAGGWEEGDNENGLPSNILKANLLSFILPQESIDHAKSRAYIFKEIQIDRIFNTYQIEYVFVENDHRGHNLAGALINEHIKQRNRCNHIYIQVFCNNDSAIISYKKCGFIIKKIYKSNNIEVDKYLPFNQKFLMKRTISHGKKRNLPNSNTYF